MCMPPLRTPSGLPALGGNPAGLCSSPSPSTSPSSTSNSLDSLGTVEEAGTPTTERRPDAAAQPPRPPQWPCPEGDDGCAHLPAARLEVRRGDGVGRAWRVLTQGARGGYVLLEQLNNGVHQKAHMTVVLAAPIAAQPPPSPLYLQSPPPQPDPTAAAARGPSASFPGPDSSARVVIKMIRRSWLRRMQQDGAGIGELGALQRLIRGEGGRPHPNVVPLLEALADRAFLYLVFPYAEGGELFQRVRKVYPQGMPEAEARACFAQVVAGLGRLKAAELTHGDVSLENVVLTWPSPDARVPTCRLIDLEMARPLAHDDDSGSCGGCKEEGGSQWAQQPSRGPVIGFKPGYASPEIVARRVTDWAAADIWSLGISLYNMLTARPMYTRPEDDAFAWLARGKAATLVYHYAEHYGSRLPALAAHLVCRMLHPDPAQRPTLEEVAAHPWLFEGGKEAGVGVGVECYHAAAGCTPFLVPRWHGGWGLGEQKEEGGSSSAAGSAAGAGMEVDGPRPSGGGSPAQ